MHGQCDTNTFISPPPNEPLILPIFHSFFFLSHLFFPAPLTYTRNALHHICDAQYMIFCIMYTMSIWYQLQKMSHSYDIHSKHCASCMWCKIYDILHYTYDEYIYIYIDIWRHTYDEHMTQKESHTWNALHHMYDAKYTIYCIIHIYYEFMVQNDSHLTFPAGKIAWLIHIHLKHSARFSNANVHVSKVCLFSKRVTHYCESHTKCACLQLNESHTKWACLQSVSLIKTSHTLLCVTH